MAISVGDTLPNATLTRMGAEGPEQVEMSSLTDGRKVVVFAVPGAYTPTCTSSHMPSFVKNANALKEKGVEDIICVSVNDPFVMKSWAAETGADGAGIHALGDAESEFTKAIGMDFDSPPAGLIGRSKRYSMVVDNGKVTHLNVEDNPGECSLSAGETLLNQL